jgi:hypothetical protein
MSALTDELAQKLRTQTIIVADAALLSPEQINLCHKTCDADNSPVAGDWKRQGRIFSVNNGGKEFFPAYQFDDALQPRPIIKTILEALGDQIEGWNVAAWFHFPNGWLSHRDARGAAVAVAPKDALDRPDDVIAAARKNRATYLA